MIGGPGLGFALMLGAIGAPAESRAAEPDPEPLPWRGRWRQRIRTADGGLTSIDEHSREAVIAEVERVRAVEQSRADRIAAQQAEANARWEAERPEREAREAAARAAWEADQPRREAADAAQIAEGRRAALARQLGMIPAEGRERLSKAEEKRARKAAKRSEWRDV